MNANRIASFAVAALLSAAGAADANGYRIYYKGSEAAIAPGAVIASPYPPPAVAVPAPPARCCWMPADLLGDGFEAPPFCCRQGQVRAGVLAHLLQAPEELAVPAAEAPLLLQEFTDPLPRGHTFVLRGAGAPLSRTPVITPGLMPPRS